MHYAFRALSKNERWGIRDIADPAGLPLVMGLVAVVGIFSAPLQRNIVYFHEQQADMFGLNVARDGVRRISIRDAAGGVLIELGKDEADLATVDEIAQQVSRTMRVGRLRGNGGLALAAPIEHGDEFRGVVAIMWDGDAYRFDQRCRRWRRSFCWSFAWRSWLFR